MGGSSVVGDNANVWFFKISGGSGFKIEDDVDNLANPVGADDDEKADKGIGEHFLAAGDLFGIAAAGEELETAGEEVN